MQASGVRMVFDEAGVAQDPLALLASAELGGADPHGDAGQGMYIVKERPEERFKAAADFLRR